MPNRDEIQAQIDALTKQLQDDDEGTELWVKDEKGRETKLTGAYARKWLRNLGLEDDEPQGDGQGDEPDPAQADPPPSGGKSVWGRK
jgi:hypothetical protein